MEKRDSDVTVDPSAADSSRAEINASVKAWFDANTTSSTAPAAMTLGDLLDPTEGARARREAFARQQREADERHEAVLQFRQGIKANRERRVQANRDRVDTARAMTLVARVATDRPRDERVQPRRCRTVSGGRAGPSRPRPRLASEDSEPDPARRS